MAAVTYPFYLQMTLGVTNGFEKMKLCLTHVPHQGTQIIMGAAVRWPKSKEMDGAKERGAIKRHFPANEDEAPQKPLTLTPRGSGALPTGSAMCPSESCRNYNAFWHCGATL